MKKIRVCCVGMRFRSGYDLFKDICPTKVTFVREPDNKYDPNAIKIIADDVHVGYVPRESNTDFILEFDHSYPCTVQKYNATWAFMIDS